MLEPDQWRFVIRPPTPPYDVQHAPETVTVFLVTADDEEDGVEGDFAQTTLALDFIEDTRRVTIRLPG